MDITHSSVPAPPKPPSIYFGGCCFGAAYYVGVHKAMCEIWGNDYYKSTLLSGGSAGTIFAIAIALGKSPEYLDDMYRRVSAKATRDGPVYYASKYMVDALYEILEDPQAYKKLEGRCIFGSTHFFAQHIWHSSWTSNEDVVRCVQASIHVPFYCMRMEPLKGSYPVDGAYGFSGIDLPHGDDTLYVGFDPHAEIACHLSNAEMVSVIILTFLVDIILI